MTIENARRSPPKFVVFALPGARLSSLGAALDALNGIRKSFLAPLFRDRSTLGMELLTASVDGRAVSTAHGDCFKPDLSIEAIGSARGVFVANFDAEADFRDLPRWQIAATKDWLSAIHASGGVIAGSESAASFLAQTCMPDNGLVSLPVDVQVPFKRRRPDIHFAPEDSVCEHNRVITAGTVGRELEMLCRFLGATMSPAAAQWFAKRIGVVIPHAEAEFPLLECHDPLVARTQSWMRDRYWQQVSVRDAALYSAVSERTLTRRFRKALGVAPHRFLIDVRIDAAKRLLARTQLSVAEVASLVGYPDLRHFRQIFEQNIGKSPAQFRKLNPV